MSAALSIVLPCYNESQNIPAIVERLKTFYRDGNFELILVNNGSTDNTAEVIKRVLDQEPGFVRAVTVEKNRGYGHGIFMGLKAAQGGIVAYSHADIQTPPEDCLKAFEILNQGSSVTGKVLVKGRRINRSHKEAFFTRWLSRFAGIVLGHQFEDINGQPKIFSRSLLETFEDPPDDFTFDLYVMYMAQRHGFILKTFPVDFGERAYGQSSWASSFLKKYKTIVMYMVNICRMRYSCR